MTSEEKRLQEVIAAVYQRRREEISVSPAWLATEALQELDPTKAAPELVYRAAHLQLRQMARVHCRGAWEKGDSEEQHEMFPDLQRRYPTARSASAPEPQYILLEHLTAEDVAFNVGRLRREGTAKLRSADALEAWGTNRFAQTA